MRAKVKCPGCEAEYIGRTNEKSEQFRGRQRAVPFTVFVCTHCGLIGVLEDNGKRRPLTRAERAALPTDCRAGVIREYQESIVAKMWG
jgi:hypothetical protein